MSERDDDFHRDQRALMFDCRKWLMLAFLFAFSEPAFSGISNPGSGSGGSSGAGNGAQIGAGSGDLQPANFINVLKPSTMSFNTPSDAGKVDDDGYLTSSPSGNVNISVGTAGSIWSNTTYKFNWDAGVQFSAHLNFAVSSVSLVNATFVSNTLTTTGGAGSMTFTIDATITSFSIFFIGGSTFSHTLGSTLALYRLSDEADYLAGEIFTPEYKSVLKFASAPTPHPPKTIRPMGWTQSGPANFNGETTWNYRIKPTTLTWNSRRYPPGAWGGTISGTDTYTGAAAPDTPGTWTNGETYTGVFTNANTSTTPTLNINSRGAKTIIDFDALTPLSAGSIAAGSIGTVVYDGILDKLLYAIPSPDGIQASIPIEAQAQLANRINANLWATVPPWATDNYVTNWATTACSNLNSSLYLYPEYSNEVWNFGFPQTQWASQRGVVFGFSTGSNQAVYGWYGLRVRQIMGNLIPAACGGHKLRRVLAYQAFGDTSNQFNRFEGSQLCPVASGGLCAGNAAYNTFTGSANYSTVGSRPIDVVEVLSAAFYTSGENLCLGGLCTPTSANAPFYQSLVTAWETPNAAQAIALVDNDVRFGTTLSQTVTCSGTTFTTPSAHSFVANSTAIRFTVSGGTAYSGIAINTLYRVTSTPLTTTFTIQPYVGGFPSGANVNCGSAGSGTVTVGATSQVPMATIASNILQFGETNATRYDATRGSLAPLRVEQYEGAIVLQGPSAAQCTSLGITGTNCTGSIAAAILAWKNDPTSKTTQTAYFNQFMGTDSTIPPTFGLMPHSRTPSQLILSGACDGSGGLFSMLSGCLPNSTPYQLYNGFAAFSGLP